MLRPSGDILQKRTLVRQRNGTVDPVLKPARYHVLLAARMLLNLNRKVSLGKTGVAVTTVHAVRRVETGGWRPGRS
jgi:hypothetical protein